VPLIVLVVALGIVEDEHDDEDDSPGLL